jgi:hypothetical protein
VRPSSVQGAVSAFLRGEEAIRIYLALELG